MTMMIKRDKAAYKRGVEPHTSVVVVPHNTTQQQLLVSLGITNLVITKHTHHTVLQQQFQQQGGVCLCALHTIIAEQYHIYTCTLDNSSIPGAQSDIL